MVAKLNAPENGQNNGRDHTGKILVKNENGPGVVAGRTRGLCKDCKKRKLCELPIREEGVWHCEDYS